MTTNTKGDLLQEFLQLTILCEARIGSDIAAREAQAKRDYDSAVYELDVWKDERQKKDDFLAACEELGIKPDSAQAKRLKTGDPAQYEYDPKVLAKSEIVLQALVSTARAKYSRFHHLTVVSNSPSEASALDKVGVDPPPDTPVYLNIDEAEPLKKYRWDDPRWAKAIADVPLGLRDKEKKQGEHPGESRLAIIFGAMKQGDSVSFDLKTSQGWKWEVKGLTKPSDTIRPGTLGIKAFRVPHKKLMKVCTSMKNFVLLVHKKDESRVFLTQQEHEQFEIVSSFIDEEYDNIDRGEISQERIVACRRAVKAAAWLRERLKVELGWNKIGDENVSIAGKDIAMPREKYIVMLRRLMKMNPDATLTDIVDSIDVKEIFITTLRDPAFNDVDEWLDRWDESINIEKIFADVSGIILAYPDGFVKVPRKLLYKTFKLVRVSKGIPYYTTRMVWS